MRPEVPTSHFLSVSASQPCSPPSLSGCRNPALRPVGRPAAAQAFLQTAPGSSILPRHPRSPADTFSVSRLPERQGQRAPSSGRCFLANETPGKGGRARDSLNSRDEGRKAERLPEPRGDRYAGAPHPPPAPERGCERVNCRPRGKPEPALCVLARGCWRFGISLISCGL